MQTITAEKFQKIIELDPAWASKLTEPVKIKGHCYLRDSGITHLSPLLHFTGKNKYGDAASFIDCPNLKVAEGTFHGCATFHGSGIEKINREGLVITEPNEFGNAGDFCFCKNLKVAEGTFPGFVTFEGTRVEEVGRLLVTKPAERGEYARWRNTPVMENNPQSVVQKLWWNKSTKELREIHDALTSWEDDPLKKAILDYIKIRLETLKRKNAAVEIKID